MDVTTPTNERPGPVLEEQDGLMPDLPVPSLVASDESSPELPPIVSPGLEDKPFDLNAAPRLPECWGHRGASANFPENTLMSFVEACKAGADGIETDIHMTSDDELVMFHDPELHPEWVSQPGIKDVVPMLSLVNEVRGSFTDLAILGSFYHEAYQVIRGALGYGAGNGPFIVLHEGFVGAERWIGFMPGADRLVMDAHPYKAFSPGSYNLPWSQQLADVCGWGRPNARSNAEFGLTIGGEWSLAINDCGKWLNGIGQNAGFGDCTGFEDWRNYDEAMKTTLLPLPPARRRHHTPLFLAFLVGVAYQPQGRLAEQTADNEEHGGFPEPDSYIDPLSSKDNCTRDLPHLQELGVNAVRVYSVDPSKNHDDCMKLFDDNGIYVLLDLSLPANGSINRAAPSWTTALLDEYMRTKYPGSATIFLADHGSDDFHPLD
ncbi:hypothetical protein A1Q1_04826 [Trichosporon asahii var. asahii CBS 2479]|uniref:1,3-beta-glucanosyltransferase n=1 Tax=Trichosporon asahii var. asahii (strain ATCC 90039 / CBS 2479 / JCM 2466 / KCTC 7840 / NBRC 103889/ NCYC 2677 / UAMH 7654) TaxID=1186058 RepID=J6EQA2_TRIAS|nr:hypothetical protein A1Q1_04826 [Trichosporon asahii var. asahii CBS 2479]EJT46649.1 hypothetical protein A1Q1_04826 [Trichosporon asahii var. asahii CBS 2479]